MSEEKGDEVIGNAPASPDIGYSGDEKSFDADAMKLAGKFCDPDSLFSPDLRLHGENHS
jgi:hypothetical protein